MSYDQPHSHEKPKFGENKVVGGRDYRKKKGYCGWIQSYAAWGVAGSGTG